MVNNGSPAILTSTSVLTGTTGTDGPVSVSVNGGVVYVENRQGGATRFSLSVIQNQSF